MDELRGAFAKEDIDFAVVISETPDLRRPPGGASSATRAREITAWLAAHSPTECWVVLDDQDVPGRTLIWAWTRNLQTSYRPCYWAFSKLEGCPQFRRTVFQRADSSQSPSHQ